MAQKKRKAARNIPPQPSHFPSASAGKWSAALPALGALALVVAWLAALGGVADGTLDWRKIFEQDTAVLPLMYSSLVSPGGYAASDWGFGSPLYFPDMAFQWAALATGMDFRVILYLAPLAQVALSATGWMLVGDRLYGKSPLRRAAVWLLHALAFLTLAWRGEDVLGLHMLTAWHYGAWAAIPWLLWLSLRALEGDLSSGKTRMALAWLFLAVAVAAASDLVLLPWFIVPAALCALLTTPRNAPSMSALAAYLAALAAGTGAAFVLGKLPGFRDLLSAETHLSFNPQLIARAFETLTGILRRMAADNGLEAVVWILFVAVSLWRLFIVFPRLDIWGRRAKTTEPRDWRHSLFGAPPGRSHCFVAVFIPASAAASVAAVLATGNLHPHPWVYPGIERVARHFLPFVYFPLFVGWALLPWKFEIGKVRVRPVPALAAALALTVLLAAPKALSIGREKLDPFATPFQRCFAENAGRLEWSAGVATRTHMLLMNPDAGINRMARVWVIRDGGKTRLFPGVGPTNISWWQGGDFQFVAVNLFNGRVFGRPPRQADKGCAPNYPEIQQCIQATPIILDEATARNVFGEPAEVIDCAGVGLLHYDPPLRFDPPESVERLREWEVRPLP